MRNLLQDADRDRLVAPLALTLARQVVVGGTPHHALAEAAGSPFFPAEANARAAELFLQPGIRDGGAELSEALLDFVMAMAEAPLPCRRAVSGRVELHRADPADVEARTPFFRLTGDLSRGELRQQPRGAEMPRLLHSGNLVEFGIGLRRACVDVEETITDQSVAREGDRLVLRHVSTIRGRGAVVQRGMEVGRLECRYELSADSPLMQVTVSFTAARRLARVRVTTALDAVEEAGLGGTAVRIREGAGWRSALPPEQPGPLEWASGAPVAHIAIGAEGWPAGLPAIHLRPAAPDRVMSVTAEARRGGELHWLLIRHGPMDLARGDTLVARESRLLCSIGDPRLAAAAMEAGQRPEMAGLDLVPAGPSGAALHAVAAALMLDAAGAWRSGLPEARRAALSGFAARQAARLEAAELAAEDVAYAVLAGDALRRALQGPGVQQRFLDRLLALVGASGAVMRDARGVASLSAQALAILALARSATWAEGGAPALAVLPPLLEAVTPGAPGAPIGLGFAGAALDPAAEAEGIALLGRAAGAVALAAEAGAAVPPAALDRARELHRVAVHLLRGMVRPAETRLEVLPRGRLEPAAQALATLAFLAPDRAILVPARAEAAR